MRTFLLLAASSVAMWSAEGVRAQATPGGPTESDVTANEGLTEIIVTAQRREENLQNAAVAVDVVQGSELIDAGITDVSTLGQLTPALTVEPSSSGNLLFVRGVGNFTVVPTSDPAIAFNYDGVYLGRPTSTTTAFFDIDRVEVLKGPQGTLYGRNATGGAINVIPTRPRLGETSGYLSGSYSSYNDVFVEGALNLEMGESGALRVSGAVKNRDGYYADGTSDDVSDALRVQMMAQLTPELTVRVAGDYAHQGGSGVSATYFGRYQFAGPAAGYVFVPSNLPLSEGFFTPAAQAFRRTASAGPAGRLLNDLSPMPYRDNEFFGVNAEIEYDTGFGTLTLIPAWRRAELDNLISAAAFTAASTETDEQFSVEARFTGERRGMIDYTLGAFYYDEKIAAPQQIFISALASIFTSKLTTESFAPFGRLTAHLSERLRVVGGIRYTHDRKTFNEVGSGGTIVCQIMTPAGPSCPNAPLFPFVTNFSQLPFAFPPASLLPPAVPIGGGAVAVRTNRNQSNSLSDSRVTWRGAVEYDIAPRSLLYASVETGFRSGGFSGAAGFETYDPEYITAYTIGSKNRFFDNRLQFNVEGFYWKYRDQQVNFVGLDNAGRTANQTRNIGSSSIMGFDAEARFLVTETTLLGAQVQYLDTETKSFLYPVPAAGLPPLTGCKVGPGATAALLNVDCSGFPAYNSPKWTINLSAQQTVPLGGYDLVLSGDTQYKGERYIAFGYLPEELAPAYWRSNAQVSFGPREGFWSIAGFVQNIENTRTPTFMTVAPVTNLLIATTTAPRIYGARASFKF